MKTQYQMDYALSLFKGVDDLRPQYQLINFDGKYNCATNGIALIRIKSEFCAVEYYKVENYPNIDEYYKKVSSNMSNVIGKDLLLSELFEYLMKFELSFRFNKNVEDCDVCKGSGVIDCPCCGNEAECKNCDGTGKIEINTPFAKLKTSSIFTRIKLGNKYFRTQELERLLHACMAIQPEKILHYQSEGNEKTDIFTLIENNEIIAEIVIAPTLID